jgi:phenylpyruvate tautomerase PptA (4-oxalocrotonate tautomerase family)
MPVVNVNWYKGRDKETKQKIAEIIDKAMIDHAGCKSGDTHVVFNDVVKENWFIGEK